MRYLIGAYPFFLIVASFALYRLSLEVYRRNYWLGHAAVSVFFLAIIGGALGGHGIASALESRDLGYGAVPSKLIFGFNSYPDHQAAGRFVASKLAADDIVIVEDALQQFWYAGQIDYWLRDPESNFQFMYVDDLGIVRDIYVNSRVMVNTYSEPACVNEERSIWYISSGEMTGYLEQYLSQEQREWRSRVVSAESLVFMGRDQQTNVYRLSCRSDGN